jgi:hypothetical protein
MSPPKSTSAAVGAFVGIVLAIVVIGDTSLLPLLFGIVGAAVALGLRRIAELRR